MVVLFIVNEHVGVRPLKINIFRVGLQYKSIPNQILAALISLTTTL